MTLKPARELNTSYTPNTLSSSNRHLRSLLLWFVFWMALFVLALLLDRPVAQRLYDSGLAAKLKDTLLAEILKFPGDFKCTALVAIIALAHPWRWKAGGLILLAAIVSGINGLIKWSAGRVRPFKVPGHPDELLPFNLHPFAKGFRGLFNASNQCFPSGHAALAFATAAMLSILVPRYRYVFYAVATIVGLERIIENAHYTSDVVAAAILGIVGAKAVYWICDRLFNPPEPLPDLASSEISA
jgi:membrane-associated phospholipid phosphatase